MHKNSLEQDQALRNFLIGKPFDPEALSYALEAQTEQALQDAEENAAEELCNQVTPLENRIMELEAELEEAKDALFPFGELSQTHQETKQDDEPIFAVNGKEITYGDVRKAKELAQ